jgi:hypothetical protein
VPSIEEIRSAIRGAVMLAQRNPAGMEEFNLSVEGFFHSFVAALLSAPIYFVLLAQRYTAGELEASGSAVLGELIAYTLGWLVFPIAAVFLTRLFGLGRGYVPLIVATNWAALIQAVAFLAAAVIGGFLGPLGMFVLLLTMIAVIVYEWYVVRTALDTTTGIAVGFVAVDVMLSFLLTGLSDAIFRY